MSEQVGKLVWRAEEQHRKKKETQKGEAKAAPLSPVERNLRLTRR
jgi:hypothetical protein